jgi:hypothetical protein
MQRWCGSNNGIAGDDCAALTPAPALYEPVCSSLLHGWRFWSLAAEDAATSDHASPPVPAGPKTGVTKPRLQIKRVANQRGVEEGRVRWFCSGCMKSFLLPTGQEPAACPEGHPWQVQDEGEAAEPDGS